MNLTIVSYWEELFGRLVSSWTRQLRELGHAVTIVHVPFDCPDPLPVPAYSEANLLLCGRRLLRNLSTHGLPKSGRNVVWLFDPVTDERGDEYDLFVEVSALARAVLCRADAVIAMDPLGMEFLQRHLDGVRVTHLPVTFDCEDILRPTLEDCRSVDVLQIGARLPRREQAEQKLRAHSLSVHFMYGGLWGRPREELLAKSRIALNIHRSAHRHVEQFRIFEAWAAGVPVVSEPCDGLERFGIHEGEHLLTAELDEMPAVCSALLADADRRAEIVAASQSLLRDRFTTQRWLPELTTVLCDA